MHFFDATQQFRILKKSNEDLLIIQNFSDFELIIINVR